MSETPARSRPNVTGNAFLKQILRRKLVQMGCEVVFKNKKYHEKGFLQEKQGKIFILYKGEECPSLRAFTQAICKQSNGKLNQQITFGNMTYADLQSKLDELVTENASEQNDPRFEQALKLFGDFLKHFKENQEKMINEVLEKLDALKIKQDDEENEQEDDETVE